jgi:uncharacterized delta-60 repeat protein
VAVCLLLALSDAHGAASGDLDPRFGVRGIVTTTFGNRSILASAARALLVLPGGQIVAGGWAEEVGVFPRSARFALARYSPEGRLDASFGSRGRAIARVGGTFDSDRINALARQDDGRIVAVGVSAARITFTLDTPRFGVARFHPSGHLDRSFAGDGTVFVPFPGTQIPNGGAGAFGVVARGGGIVAVGTWFPGGATSSPGVFALADFRDDGALDPEFGAGGLVTTRVGSLHGSAYAVRTADDGGLLLAGSAIGGVFTTDPRFLLMIARYDASGSLVPGFGEGGIALVPFPGRIQNVRIVADGSIVAVGRRDLGGDPAEAEWVVVRALGDGRLDPSFGEGGVVLLHHSGGFDESKDATVDDRGRVLVTGCVDCPSAQGPRAFALARLLSDGSLDESFGAGGFAFAEIGDVSEAATVVLQRSDRVVVAGRAQIDFVDRFALAAFLTGDPPPPHARRFRPVAPSGARIPLLPR